MLATRTGDESAAPLRVLVVDDSELFRTGLQALLASEALEVAVAGSGDAALELLPTFAPDVVVMDMDMPGLSGSDATRRIREVAPDASVMVLSGNERGDVLGAVRAGASGYILKSTDVSEIVKAIRATAAGQSPFAPQVAGALVAAVRDVATPQPREVDVSLSARERQVLTLLASGCNNVEIAQRLYISASTVKSHISGLLAKLHVDNRVQAACLATRAGLVDETRSVG
jgi:DNA-binding NarL/FixJ family response regulator